MTGMQFTDQKPIFAFTRKNRKMTSPIKNF